MRPRRIEALERRQRPPSAQVNYAAQAAAMRDVLNQFALVRAGRACLLSA
jgi:hypothetical protein